MKRMYNPPPPKFNIRDDVLPALGLNVTQAAEQLGVSRVAFSRMINGHVAISPDMALRIEAWLGIDRGGEARIWLAQQSAYDIWQADLRFKIKPMRVTRAPIANKSLTCEPPNCQSRHNPSQQGPQPLGQT